jgi:hypothetical protein
MFEELIARVASVFETACIPYMIIGGQAVLLNGTPRMTRDIDITFRCHVGGEAHLLTPLHGDLPGNLAHLKAVNERRSTLDGCGHMDCFGHLRQV